MGTNTPPQFLQHCCLVSKNSTCESKLVPPNGPECYTDPFSVPAGLCSQLTSHCKSICPSAKLLFIFKNMYPEPSGTVLFKRSRQTERQAAAPYWAEPRALDSRLCFFPVLRDWYQHKTKNVPRVKDSVCSPHVTVVMAPIVKASKRLARLDNTYFLIIKQQLILSNKLFSMLGTNPGICTEPFFNLFFETNSC